MNEANDHALDSRARRAANRAGFMAVKSRNPESYDNQGGYMLIEPNRNLCVAGLRYDLTAEDVIEYCADQ
jgi:hypothetical protein